jgi:hypothetical protein
MGRSRWRSPFPNDAVPDDAATPEDVVVVVSRSEKPDESDVAAGE